MGTSGHLGQCGVGGEVVGKEELVVYSKAQAKPGVLALPCLPGRPCHFGDGVSLEEAWSSLAWRTQPAIALPPCSSLLPSTQQGEWGCVPLEPWLLP